MAMKISQEGAEITNRFFKVIEILSDARYFKGLKTFTTLHDLNRRNIMRVKNSPNNTVLKPELIALLVRYHNVSAEWLLTGEGFIFKNNTNVPPTVERKRRGKSNLSSPKS